MTRTMDMVLERLEPLRRIRNTTPPVTADKNIMNVIQLSQGSQQAKHVCATMAWLGRQAAHIGL